MKMIDASDIGPFRITSDGDARDVRFYDPDGHIIEAAEKLDAVIARFVAQGLSPEETADRMGIPFDFVVSSLNVAK